MRYRVAHTTAYSYAAAVSACHNEVRLTPRDGGRQRRLRSELRIDPAPAILSTRNDYFGNLVTSFSVQEPHTKLTVAVESEVEVEAKASAAPSDRASTPAWERVRDALPEDLSREGLEAYQLVFDSAYVSGGPLLSAYAAPSFLPGRPLLEAVLHLAGRIFEEFTYDRTATTLATPLAGVLGRRRGVCQDFAHVLIACLRSLGLAARYVSGYLFPRPRAGEERVAGAGASHAWASVYCPGLGFTDVDPTIGQLPSGRHITLAWGRDYGDVTPVKGVVLGGGRHAMTVSVDVARLG